MKRAGRYSFLAMVLALFAGQPASTATTNPAPDFREVYELLRSHLTGVSEAELNRAAVHGLLSALGPKVSLVPNRLSTNAPPAPPLVNRAGVIEGDIAYLRIGRVSDGLAEEVNRTCRLLGSSNTLKGVVLDLRYAEGDDYAAAAATADGFTAKAAPLLNWGPGMASSHEKTNAIRVPTAVLVNRETARAAEALAALFRETGAGLVLGGRTAGRAMITRSFPLANGEQLSIAIAPVTLGDGSALPAEGLAPDIDVTVSPEEERAYYADAFLDSPKTNSLLASRASATIGPSGTNQAPRRSRISEAELVRERKEGLEPDAEPGTPPARPVEPARPVVNDPALARALDLLKGLAMVRQDHF